MQAPSSRQTFEDLERECVEIENELLRRNVQVSENDLNLRDGVQPFPHQVEAVRFLSSRFPGGCILADEMGLGKTLETIAFMSYLSSNHNNNKSDRCKFLVVVPLSVASNWISELSRFSFLRSLLFAGTASEREEAATAFEEENVSVLVTTYEYAAKEPFVLRIPWTLMIVDEAHRLKNHEAKLYKVLETISCPRLLLTGTPVQNNLVELWSLLHFIRPDVFRDLKPFEDLSVDWRKSALGEKLDARQQKRVSQIHTMLKIFMIRRKKEEVNCHIPKKTEMVLRCQLSEMQRKLYKACFKKDSSAFQTKSAPSLTSVLVNLRKVCNHPYLFDGMEPMVNGQYQIGDHIVENSGKMVALQVLLQYFFKRGRKVLLFSTSTRALDIIQDFLTWKQIQYERLDGSVRALERNMAVKNFQAADSESMVFLLSTRAGGVGLNLVAASVVIFFDSDFNPQADLQAAARAHRIGQKEEVTVIRLMCSNSVEEFVWKRSREKTFLAEAVVEQGRESDVPKMSSKELLKVVQYGLADLDAQQNMPLLTEDDIDSMLQDAGAVAPSPEIDDIMENNNNNNNNDDDDDVPLLRRASTSGSNKGLKRAKTLIRVDDGLAELTGSSVTSKQKPDFVDESSTGEGRGARDAAALRALVNVSNIEPESSRPRRAPTSAVRPPRATPEERLKALWERNDYMSFKLAPAAGASDDDDDDNNYAMALLDQEPDLNFVSGDCAECEFGDADKPKVVLVAVDASGEFGSGGFFASIERSHGPLVAMRYGDAKRNKDLHRGDCHIVGSERSNCHVALMIAMKSRFEFDPSALLTSMRALAAYCVANGASVHCPRFANIDWYTFERFLRKAFCSKSVPCFVYYFQRRPIAPPMAPDLPNFLEGCTLHIDMLDPDQQKLLARHAVAYGAELSQHAGPDIITVSDHIDNAVQPEWLEQCFAQQRLVEK